MRGAERRKAPRTARQAYNRAVRLAATYPARARNDLIEGFAVAFATQRSRVAHDVERALRPEYRFVFFEMPPETTET
jgi:hypothetical protein